MDQCEEINAISIVATKICHSDSGFCNACAVVYKYGTATNLIDLEDTRQRRKHAELYPLCVFPISDVVWKWDGQVGFGVAKAQDRFGIRFMSFRIQIKYLFLCSRTDVAYLEKYI